MDLGSEIIKGFEQAYNTKQPLVSYWKDAFAYTFPIRGQGFTVSYQDGSSVISNAAAERAVIFDSTATDSVRLLASSMISGLTPSNSKWFALSLPGIDYDKLPLDARLWLENATTKLHDMIHQANYDSEAFEFFIDIVIGGMAGLYVDLVPNEGFVFEFWPLSDFYVSETRNTKRIDTVFRIVHLTAAQAASRFGVDNLPQEMRNILQDNPMDNRTYEFIHGIRPRLQGGKISKGKRTNTMPYESVYIHRGTRMVCSVGGYNEFPVIIPRWMCVNKTSYAVGPLDAALPDVKTLNKLKQIVLTNAELQVAGTYVAKEDGILNPNTVVIGPRRIIFAADTANIKPLANGGDIKIADWLINQLQTQIRKVMMSDQLQPYDKPYSTATEVQVRTQLIRKLLGPIYGRFQAEFLMPLLDRTFGLAFRNGYFGPLPASLEGIPLVPEYQSPLARAQRLEDLDSMNQFESQMMPLVQAFPQVLDLYDADKATRRKADLLGVPIDVMRDDKSVKQLRKAKAEQAQQMAAMQANAEQ